MDQPKALIAMSGGVDSSVAAWLMQQQGFSCVGAMMHLHEILDTADAQKVADSLNMPFLVLDCREAFRQSVMAHFAFAYEAGLTPNPCVVCNQKLKFGVLLDKALDLGCQWVVTGHYAQILFDEESGRWQLKKAADALKDQSYFLYGLSQHQLAHSRFPLGSLTKDQVRTVAEAQGFVNARKKDSQDICFVPGGDYVAFLEGFRGVSYAGGDYLDLTGKKVGTHRGAVAYTRGQRKGLGLAMGAPVYVCGKDMGANTVTVGPDSALWSRTLLADDVNWVAWDGLAKPRRCLAKARSRMTEQSATVYPEENGRIRVVFDEPQRALTEGQAVVLYDGDTVLAGGTITLVE